MQSGDNTKNYYAILGVAPTATMKEIKNKWHKLARESHPDKNGNLEQMQVLNEAYAVLADSKKRKAYDSARRFNQSNTANPVSMDHEYEHDIGYVFISALRERWMQYSYEQKIISEKTKQSFMKYKISERKWNHKKANKFRPRMPVLYKEMKDSFKNMTKPYQSYDGWQRNHIVWHVLQPLRGIANFLLGVVSMCGLLFFPIVILLSPLLDCCLASGKYPLVQAKAIYNGARGGFFLSAKAAFQFSVLGIFQLLSTPVTWLVSIPVRGIITLMNGGFAKIETRSSFNRVLREAHYALKKRDKKAICTTVGLLHEKFKYARLAKHLRSQVGDGGEKNTFDVVAAEIREGTFNCHTETSITEAQQKNIRNYLNLFSNNKNDVHRQETAAACVSYVPQSALRPQKN